MSHEFTYPAQVVSIAGGSTGVNGDPIPAESTQIGGKNPSGDLTPVSVDAAGNLNVNTTLTGTPNVNLAQIIGSVPSATNSLPVELSYSNAFIDPRQIRDLASGTDSISAVQSGTWTQNLTLVGGSAIALGQALMVASLPVTIASDQTAIPVSATSLPLPTGSATAANQTSEIAQLTDINANTSHLPAALGQTTMSASLPVALASDQSALPVSAASLPLPAGAATSANQTSEITELTAINTNTEHLPAALGQTTMSASLPVTMASDQSAMKANLGRSQANAPVRNDYTVTAVTTSAYVQLVASTTSLANEIEIFDSSGQTLTLAIGASGSEVNQINIFPGGNGRIPLSIPAGTRVSIKAISATASVGELDINFYS
jgi:hypothetical protein